MSIRTSPDITKKNLYKLVGSKYGNLGKEARIELKKSGLSKLLKGDRVNKQKAMRIMRHLKKKGLVERNSHVATSSLWRRAAIKQLEQDRAAKEARVREYAFSLIQDELSQEAMDELNPLDKRYAERKLEQQQARKRGSALHANFSKNGPVSSFQRRNQNDATPDSSSTTSRPPQKPDLVV